MTQQIAITEILVEDRMRIDQGSLDSLKEAMHERGLLQAVGVQPHDGAYRLLWGGRRLEAARQLGWTEIEAKIAPGLRDYEASEIEFMENWERKSMTWQEEALGLLRIHAQRVRQGALIGEKWGQRETGRLLGISVGNVNYTLKVAELLQVGDGEIENCPNMAEALRLLLRRKESEIPEGRKSAPSETYFKKEDLDKFNNTPKAPEAPPSGINYRLYRVDDFPGMEDDSILFKNPKSIDALTLCLRFRYKVYAIISDEMLDEVEQNMLKYGSFECVDTSL